MFGSTKALNHPRVIQIALILGAALFLVVLISSLIFPVPLGLADNHDYWRMMDPFGLAYPDQSVAYFYTHISLIFLKILPWHWEVMSSGLIFVAIAYILTWFLQWNIFPLIVLGIVYCLFYTLAYYLFLRNAYHRTFFR